MASHESPVGGRPVQGGRFRVQPIQGRSGRVLDAGPSVRSVHTQALEDARQPRRDRARDCETAARQFVAMLRGESASGNRLRVAGVGRPGEVRAHVRSVVEVFLRGARGSAPVIGADAGRAVDAAAFSLDFGTTQALTACGLIREIGESINEVVGADDWQAASPWAEAVWDSYSASTGISWEQASGRIHEAWKASSTRGYGTLATD